MQTDETTIPVAPTSLSDILADIMGFGIEEFEEVLTLRCNGKDMRLKLGNFSLEADLEANLAVEGLRDYAFFQSVKIHLLSHAIVWINGRSLVGLTKAERLCTDPTDGELKDIRAVLRSLIRSWGVEVTQVLWKCLMVHAQNIENRLFENFPQVAILTEAERRYTDRVEKELLEETSRAIKAKADELVEVLTDMSPDEEETA